MLTDKINDIVEQSDKEDAAYEEQGSSGQGPLLEKEEEKAAALALKYWKAQDKAMNPLLSQWEVNRFRRAGAPFVRMVRDQDTYSVKIPPGTQSNTSFNRLSSTCRQMTSLLFADAPVPEVSPATGEDKDRDAAEFASRVLVDLQSEANGGLKAVKTAVDRAHTYGSGFVWESVESEGRKGPRTVLAKMSHRTLADAMMPDEETADEELVLRYVKTETVMSQTETVDKDGNVKVKEEEIEEEVLTDNVEEADKIWYPVIKSEVLTGKNLRFLPATAEDVWDAEAVIIGTFKPFSELKQSFPDKLEGMDKNEVKKLAEFKPQDANHLYPDGMGKAIMKAQSSANDPLIFVLTVIYKPCLSYPEGAYFVSAGENTVLYRGEWPRDIPITQFISFKDGRESPYGVGITEIIGPANDTRNAMFSLMMSHLERYGKRRTFLPTNSIIRPEQMRYGVGDVIPVNPGGMPTFEEVPSPPRGVDEFLRLIEGQYEQMTGLTAAAIGMGVPSVQSAKHANLNIQQTNNALSDIRQHTEEGLVRWWRIRLQLVRDFFEVVQRIKWIGEDGAYKHKAWIGADLSSECDIRIRPGSFTMMTAQQKADLAISYSQTGILLPDELRDVIASQTGPVVGVQDDPIKTRIRGQLSRWSEGPKENMDIPTQLATIFDENPTDMEPGVAQARLSEIIKFLQSSRFSRWATNPDWQQGPITIYTMAKQALNPPPPPPPGGAPDAGPVPPQEMPMEEPPMEGPIEPLPEEMML